MTIAVRGLPPSCNSVYWQMCLTALQMQVVGLVMEKHRLIVLGLDHAQFDLTEMEADGGEARYGKYGRGDRPYHHARISALTTVQRKDFGYGVSTTLMQPSLRALKVL